jgi:two-component system, OmpR family, sensor histidine kinase KdpD
VNRDAHGDDEDAAETTTGGLVDRTLTAVREDLRAQAYLFDDPGTYSAGVDDCLAATEEQLCMEVEAVVHEQLDVLTHEIITPACVIQTGVETLRERGPDLSESDRRAVFDSVYRNAVHLTTLLRDLRRSGADDDRPVVVDESDLADVQTVTRSVVDDENRLIGTARARITLHDDLDDHLVAAIDPHSLRRILNALLSNAIKYGGSDRVVTVSLEPAGDHVEIRVADEGPGIPEGREEVIFDKFRRLDPRPSGSGLGLYLARRLAREHGGDLTVESRAGCPGAVFLLRLATVTEVPDLAAGQVYTLTR